MFRLSSIKLSLLAMLIAALAACGGTSTDTGNPLDSTGQLSTDQSSTPTDTGGGANTDPDPDPAPTPTPTPTPGDPNPVAVIAATPTSGLVTLQVNVDATQSTDDQGIISYAWSFGDGNVSQSPVTSHNYNQAGTYTLTLTVADGEGNSDTTSTQIHVFNTLDNSQVVVPAGVTFLDQFDYVVERDNTSYPGQTDNPFINEGGWVSSKAININGSHRGYLYTVSEIPGYSGTFPGRNSNRVLAIESLGGSMCTESDPVFCQTDIYLEYGDGSPDSVPGDVWFQFWIYPNQYNDPTDQNDQMSAYHSRSKFIYPCNGFYPCQSGDIKWLYMLGHESANPHWANQDDYNIHELYMTTFDAYGASAIYEPAPSWDQTKLGQTDVSEYLRPNRWTLVKLHFDTSGNNSSQGIYEAWVKPLGGSWTKVADWQGGVTPGFTWNLDNSGGFGGHSRFRMPTTVDRHDSWSYMDDFAIATSEADLPVYPY